MKYHLISAFFFCLIVLGCNQAETTNPIKDASSDNIPLINNTNKKIVVLKHGADKAKFVNFAQSIGVSVDSELGLVNGFAITLPSEAATKAFNIIVKRLDVELIEDDAIGYATQTQTTPWGIDRVDFDLSWSYSCGSGVKVGVIDTGIDTDHPDLVDNIAGGIHYVSGVTSYEDDHSHGTHVSGTIAAVNNTIGVVGGATAAQIYAIKALDRNGSCYVSQIVKSLDWAIKNNMKIVNMSLGFTSYSSTLHNAIKSAANNGILLVAAAGNNSGKVMYPAAFSEVVAVSSIDKYNKLSSFSSRGPEIDLAAPGSSIRSTTKGNTYSIKSGTSMACPHVVAAAVLVMNMYPNATAAQVIDHLKKTAENLNLSTYYQGAGLVDAEKAVKTPL